MWKLQSLRLKSIREWLFAFTPMNRTSRNHWRTDEEFSSSDRQVLGINVPPIPVLPDSQYRAALYISYAIAGIRIRENRFVFHGSRDIRHNSTRVCYAFKRNGRQSIALPCCRIDHINSRVTARWTIIHYQTIATTRRVVFELVIELGYLNPALLHRHENRMPCLAPILDE